MAQVCVHGLGYIGLPTAMLFAKDGVDVIGRDVDEDVLDRLERGDVDIHDPELESFVLEALDSGNFTCSEDVVSSRYHLICVPTPFTAESARNDGSGRTDLSYVKAAARSIAPRLRPGDTVILESTVPPGTTAEVVRPILESESTLTDELRLAYSPETVMPGNIVAELRTNDRIVGGIDERSTAAASRMYEPHVEGDIYRVSDTTTAEFIKLTQNAYRDVNIAFANELAKIARDYGVDARDAIGMANRHPRVDILRPGPGVGGHCLPVDPLFLGHGSDSLNLISEARRINDGMAEYVARLVEDPLDATDEVSVAILGVAYKGNVDDTRNSPGLRIAQRLREGPVTEVRLHDPVVHSQELPLVVLEQALADADAMLLTANHDEFRELEPTEVKRRMDGNLVVDPLDVVNEERWTREGFTVEQL